MLRAACWLQDSLPVSEPFKLVCFPLLPPLPAMSAAPVAGTSAGNWGSLSGSLSDCSDWIIVPGRHAVALGDDGAQLAWEHHKRPGLALPAIPADMSDDSDSNKSRTRTPTVASTAQAAAAPARTIQSRACRPFRRGTPALLKLFARQQVHRSWRAMVTHLVVRSRLWSTTGPACEDLQRVVREDVEAIVHSW